MDANTIAAVVAAAGAVAAALAAVASLPFTRRAANAASDQTALQAEIAREQAQPYVWADIQPLKAGKNIMDLEDFIVSNCLLPLGSLVMVLFCTRKFGWGWDKFTAEANTGKGLKVKNWMKPLFCYIVPVVVLALYIIGLVNFKWS